MPAVATGVWAGTGAAAPRPTAPARRPSSTLSTTSALTVTLDSPQTVGTLALGNSGGDPTVGYTVSGTNTLTLDNTGSTALVR